jgi:hypothetical protein
MSPTLLERASRQLELLALRSLELADRVAAGEIAFLDAVDIAYDAAVWSGLTSTVGDDIVQATLAAAFRKCAESDMKENSFVELRMKKSLLTRVSTRSSG